MSLIDPPRWNEDELDEQLTVAKAAFCEERLRTVRCVQEAQPHSGAGCGAHFSWAHDLSPLGKFIGSTLESAQ